jgi:hypothetical protein
MHSAESCRLITTAAAPNAQLAGDSAAPGALLIGIVHTVFVEWDTAGTCQSTGRYSLIGCMPR